VAAGEVYRLLQLEHRDRGLESHSNHGCISIFSMSEWSCARTGTVAAYKINAQDHKTGSSESHCLVMPYTDRIPSNHTTVTDFTPVIFTVGNGK
jgi:hypothetical protein